MKRGAVSFWCSLLLLLSGGGGSMDEEREGAGRWVDDNFVAQLEGGRARQDGTEEQLKPETKTRAWGFQAVRLEQAVAGDPHNRGSSSRL